MKKYYLYIGLLTLASCSFLSVRNPQTTGGLAEPSRGVSSAVINDNVIYFDASTLEGETVKMKYFDLNNQLTDLKSAVEQFIGLYDVKVKSNKNDEKEVSNTRQFVEGKNLQKPYNSFELADKGLYYSAKKIRSLISDIDTNPESKEIKLYQIAQLAQAIYQKYTAPAKDEYEILALPITLLKHMYYPAVQNNNEVATLSTYPEIHAEFVSAPDAETAANLYSYKLVPFDSDNCRYLKSKKGYGVHSGFQIKCGEQTFKVKFGGEIYSGPFNTRVYSRLGYKVPTINYVEALHMKYDRRVIQEYNQRAVLNVNITLANQNVYKFHSKIMRDPFLDISKFIMKDKSEVSSAEVKMKLMKKYDKNSDPADADFNVDFENQIESIVLYPATLTLKDNSDSIEVGPWRADELNYAQFKEVRALMVLSAWVGNFDVRKDNLSVYLENPKAKNAAIKVGFGDVGSGLGKATYGLSKITSSEINNMVWEVSATYRNSNGESMERDRIQLIGLMNIEVNKAFQDINLADAQWMLQKICQLSKENLLEALVASGMSSAEVALASEKLIFRRNRMLIDFDASKELVGQCYVPADKKINYDPNTDGLIQVKNSAGELVAAPARNYKVQKGILISN